LKYKIPARKRLIPARRRMILVKRRLILARRRLYLGEKLMTASGSLGQVGVPAVQVGEKQDQDNSK